MFLMRNDNFLHILFSKRKNGFFLLLIYYNIRIVLYFQLDILISSKYFIL